MTLLEWFSKGLTYQEYVDQMTVNREEMLSIDERIHLSEDDQNFLQSYQSKQWRVIILTADWCGDAMLCVPILKRMAEVAHFDLRFLHRDENLELMDQYLTNGKSRSIPKFIFIDDQGVEQAVWGPRAVEVQLLVDQMQSELPNQEDPQFKEKQKEMYQAFRDKISSDPKIWQSVICSLRQLLS
ncbi:thioredoxin family protein [Hazenella coriacea]|uniref:Thiol-disulfide isomerase/thioredoxin n=1 Tax=Hazenella coriacea TaxID=1179467 RepID=A0A4R3L1K4_9BACL|nr:thioredoxin family protein [Hazenella coriacea]TCS93279.1 thiol-disulfide isomerase/thioredoxin [Hazenella coriacea]